ncbi:hypothetical protein CYLTODRAFT_454483 [Cylindrobasidium torrendii FP15055 ss-10]|uniref:DUF6699 domain-containing protein n=1 Tax=Cylindrobasidium torrendii FP15055 ss-10 TaxID=1314674 RepID=A0A0D7BCV9_9AGAR|nr:hypothetical protein CYLTODRAFT_454483 [Cylindrobasidium torrendii FP15055 ss-10]
MASILRWFSSSSSSKPSPPPTSSSSSPSRNTLKSHNRSRSANHVPVPTPTPAPYIYATPPAPGPGRPELSQRSASYAPSRTVPPSPLRYNTYDSTSSHSHRSTHSKDSKRSMTPTTPLKYEMHHVPYPIYSSTPSHCGSDSRSSSSASIQPAGSASSSAGHSVTIAGSARSGSAGSIGAHDRPQRRPVLKQNHTWSAGGAPGVQSAQHAHVSFENPKRVETVHMHPLLASGRMTKAPIAYDVSYTPSPQSVVDRSTRSAVPSHTLSQPATDPPTYGKLVLRSDKLPWPVVVQSSAAKTGSKFFIGTAPTPAPGSKVAITNSDLLCAIHTTLLVRVSHDEWEKLGKGSRAQRRVTRAYEARCKRMGGGWDGGVRRIDYLGERTRLVGVEVDKDDGVAKLIFSKA